jgi:hypothetical protein
MTCQASRNTASATTIGNRLSNCMLMQGLRSPGHLGQHCQQPGSRDRGEDEYRDAAPWRDECAGRRARHGV